MKDLDQLKNAILETSREVQQLKAEMSKLLKTLKKRKL